MLEKASANSKDEAKGVDFETAVALTDFGKFNIAILILCGVNLMAVLNETLSMSYILPAACDFNLTLPDKGILSAVGFLGVVSSSLLWGFIADVSGRRNVILITTYISFILGFASSLAPYIWLFIVLRFLNCFFIGGPSAVVIAYLGEFHSNLHRARVITWSGTFIACCSFYLPGLAWAVLPMEWAFTIPGLEVVIRPWRLLIILYGLPSLISATLLLKFPESPKYLWATGKPDEALKILRNIYVSNTGNPETMYPVTQLAVCTESRREADETSASTLGKKILSPFKLLWNQIAPLYCPPYLSKTVMLSVLQFGLFSSANGFVMWLPDILNKVASFTEDNPLDPVTICKSIDYSLNLTSNDEPTIVTLEGCSNAINESVFLVSLIQGAMLIVIYLFIGLIINLTGKKLLLIFIFSLSGLIGISASFVQTYLLIFITTGAFFLSGSAITVINTVAVDLFPTQFRALAMALALMAGRFGAMCGGQLIGYFLDSYCDLVLYVFAGLYFVLLAISCLLPIPLWPRKIV